MTSQRVIKHGGIDLLVSLPKGNNLYHTLSAELLLLSSKVLMILWVNRTVTVTSYTPHPHNVLGTM